MSDFVFDPPLHGVVVGIDGSPRSVEALRFALADAARRRVPLHVVHAWTLTTIMHQMDLPFGVVPSFEECRAAATRTVTEAVEQARAGPPGGEQVEGGEPLHVHVVHAQAAPALIAASGTADLLVVAARGHGGFLGLHLGSTADQVLRHSHCPVVVVRHADAP